MIKLRHQKGQIFILQPYIQETSIWRIRDLIKVKLELLDIGKNYGNERLCCGCNQTAETTEHILACKNARELVGGEITTNLHMMSDRKNLLHLYNFLSTYIDKRNAMHRVEMTENNEEEAPRSTENIHEINN